jgi:predicted RNase H-like nuclease
LRQQHSPLDDRDYRHRVDLVDALICAWTAALWHRHGLARRQIIGAPPAPDNGRTVVIIAPAHHEQR